MSYSRLKLWFILGFTFAVVAVVIRAIWQIVVIPTSGTMFLFIPLIIALLGVDAFLAYIVIKPDKLRSLPFKIGLTVALSAGLLAGITHFVRFIISSQADPFLSKVIGSLVVLSSVSVGLLILYIVWSLQKKREDGQ